MKDSVNFPDNDDIDRLESLYSADRSFFYLAVFSMIEWYIRKFLESSGVCDSGGFRIKKYDYRPFCDSKFEKGFLSFYENYVKSSDDFLGGDDDFGNFDDIIKLIKDCFPLSNHVRHNFDCRNDIEVRKASSILKRFAVFAGFRNADMISKLDKRINESWYERKFADSDEYLLSLVDALKHPQFSQSELRNRLEKLMKLDDDTNQLNVQIHDLSKEIEKNVSIISNKDEKIAKLEAVNENLEKIRAEFEKKKSELLKLEKDSDELQSAKLQLDMMREISSYTRTRAQFEANLQLLTSEQDGIVKRAKFDRDFLVRGSAGTGKTIVLLKLLDRFLDENENSSVHFISFSKTLKKYNDYISGILKVKSNGRKNVIMTSDKYLSEICDVAFSDEKKIFDSRFDIYKFMKDSKIDFDYSIVAKIKRVLTNQTSEKEFLSERGNTADEWKTIRKVFDKFDESQVQSLYYAIYRLAMKIASDDSYSLPTDVCVDNLFIDEVQDLGKSRLTVLRRATNAHVFMAGDNEQSIFVSKFTWKSVGIDVASRDKSVPLTINFRNSIQINDFAESYRNSFSNDSVTHSSPRSLRLGPPVRSFFGADKEELIDELVADVKFYHDQIGVSYENICVITHNGLISYGKSFSFNYVSAILDRLRKMKIPAEDIHGDSFDFKKKNIVKVSTSQNCKGIDCPVVLYLADHRCHFYDVDKDIMNKKLVYTSITRASEFLNIYMLNDVSDDNISFLKLKECIKSSNSIKK